MVLFFAHRLSIGLVLNRRTLAATALYETYNILIVKKYYQFIVFYIRNITLWIPAKWKPRLKSKREASIEIKQ